MRLVIESWDHPGKEPFLINPTETMVWNSDLAEELRTFQGYQNIKTISPPKFRYIFEYNRKIGDRSILNKAQQQDLHWISEHRPLVYPMCTSSSYFAFEGELKFVEDLAVKCASRGKNLYIRPYPLAPHSDMMRLKAISGVRVGYLEDRPSGTDILDAACQLHKFLIIANSDGILNLGTTFVLDAVLVEPAIPVIQLKIRSNDYGDLGRYANGVHIQKYLHTESSILLSDFEDLEIGYQFRNELRQWLIK